MGVDQLKYRRGTTTRDWPRSDHGCDAAWPMQSRSDVLGTKQKTPMKLPPASKSRSRSKRRPSRTADRRAFHGPDLTQSHCDCKRGGGHQTAAECRNPWSCRNKKELIQRARHVGHRQGTTNVLEYLGTVHARFGCYQPVCPICSVRDSAGIEETCRCPLMMVSLHPQNCRARPEQRQAKTRCIPSFQQKAMIRINVARPSRFLSLARPATS